MAYEELPRVTCDGCGAEKGEINHWWMLFSTMSNDDRCEDAGFTLLPFNRYEAPCATAHACGESCLHKLISRWLASPENARTFEQPAHRAGNAELPPELMKEETAQ